MLFCVAHYLVAIYDDNNISSSPWLVRIGFPPPISAGPERKRRRRRRSFSEVNAHVGGFNPGQYYNL